MGKVNKVFPHNTLAENDREDGRHLICYRGELVAEMGAAAFEERSKHLENTTPQLLELLRKYNTKLTFFVTGRLYEKNPDIIHKIYDDGHELGWHGHSHRSIVDLSTLTEELKASKQFIETFRPKGFRAPWVKFNQELLPVLRDAGFVYDSSVLASAKREYEMDGLKIFPVTALPLLRNSEPQYNTGSRFFHSCSLFPVGSNFLFSLLRYKYDMVLRFYEARSQHCMFYLHNWQLFPWPEREMSLVRDKLRYVQKFPLAAIVEYLLERHDFFRVSTLLGSERPKSGHFLTFDME